MVDFEQCDNYEKMRQNSTVAMRSRGRDMCIFIGKRCFNGTVKARKTGQFVNRSSRNIQAPGYQLTRLAGASSTARHGKLLRLLSSLMA